MKSRYIHIVMRLAWLIAAWTAVWTAPAQTGEEPLERYVRFSISRGTRYEYLNQITEQTGYLFLYDSRVVRNDQTVRLPKGEYRLREAIRAITGDPGLTIRLSGDHILLTAALPEDPPEKTGQQEEAAKQEPPALSGRIVDRISGEPIPYCSIVIDGRNTGTVTNHDGEFVLPFPGRDEEVFIHLSHVGYTSESFEIPLPRDQHLLFSLDPKIVPIQEVVVRPVDPYRELRELHRKRPENYPQRPIGLTTFYRETIEYRDRSISLSEGVFQVYHTGYESKENDQVRLIRMRRIIDAGRTAEKMPKMKSGIYGALLADLIKYPPDFLDPDDPENPYEYLYTGSTYLDGRRIHIIEFEQKETIRDPLFRGELYLDAENQALVEARFELHPDHVARATESYVERRGRGVRLNLQQVAYRIAYKPSDNGIYYPHHTRGELKFRVRLKRGFFSFPLNFHFEMVNCRTDTASVRPIPKEQRLLTRKVFAETVHSYDAAFWQGFNVILPEEKLRELILNQLSEVTVTEGAE